MLERVLKDHQQTNYVDGQKAQILVNQRTTARKPAAATPGRPGRCSAAPARTHWALQSDSDAGVSWGDGGVVRLPRFVCDGMLWTVTDALSFSGGTMYKLLTIDEASEYLGISKLTLYGWMSARKLGFIKVGRLVKFKQEHLDRWIDQHTIKPRPTAQER